MRTRIRFSKRIRDRKIKRRQIKRMNKNLSRSCNQKIPMTQNKNAHIKANKIASKPRGRKSKSTLQQCLLKSSSNIRLNRAISISSISSIELDTLTVSDDEINFAFRSYIREDHQHHIYAVEFNPFQPLDRPVFATVGANRVSIYECLPSDTDMTLLQCFEDPDKNENFFTCCWSMDPSSKHSILAVAGKRGIIRIFYPNNTNLNIKHYLGHGHAINEMKFHQKKLFLLLSVSKDRSIRLWNVQTDVCIATFYGVNGHRDEVITAAFNQNGTRIVSSGTDHMLLIWDLTDAAVADAIEQSQTFDISKSQQSFRTVYCPFPIFSTRDLHGNYVDCVKWFGDFIISKSCENNMICWKPGLLATNADSATADVIKQTQNTYSILHHFRLTDCTYFFIKFAMDPDFTHLAVGNACGVVKVWQLDVSDPKSMPSTQLRHKKCTSIVRHVTFSPCGKMLIVSCDDGTVWRWERRVDN